jgi:hypothetical protein
MAEKLQPREGERGSVLHVYLERNSLSPLQNKTGIYKRRVLTSNVEEKEIP